MPKQKPIEILMGIIKILKGLPRKDKIMLLLQIILSVCTLFICLLGLLRVIPFMFANPIGLFLLSTLFILSGIKSLSIRRAISILYFVVAVFIWIVLISGIITIKYRNFNI